MIEFEYTDSKPVEMKLGFVGDSITDDFLGVAKDVFERRSPTSFEFFEFFD